MTRTIKLVLSGVIAFAICAVLVLAMLNQAEGSSPTIRQRNTVDHITYTTR